MGAPALEVASRAARLGGVTRSLHGRRVVLAVTGSVAAYKSAALTRLLRAAGAEVDVVMTRSARRFVGDATFSGLTGRPVLRTAFGPAAAGELHVDVARRAELVIVAPATADVLARLATGRADDLVTAIALCATCPVLAAPAMHPSMWSHPATRRNAELLARDGRVTLVGPIAGEVASGDTGIGRMAEPETIAAAAASALTPRDLAGRHLVVSAGPTLEDLDPVRFLGNRSSGRMGFALAERAAARGARVTLVTGPVALATPPGVVRRDVRSALEMQAALDAALAASTGGADALLMAAAVGDYRPATTHAAKLKRSAESLTIELQPNPDLLREIARRRTGPRPVLVGFAVETGTDDEIAGYGQKKRVEKRVDVVVANPAAESFGRSDNRAVLVTAEGARWLPVLEKTVLADHILDAVVSMLGGAE
ncbi:MAG: bifunctional phosphopantothenoylcysteine decarboxylase/phosphopantothenate--cysteine ligase CoaBC [Polyangiaceae bacterium]|nr:bifunctional phosphopantothenoylcysteine decarboxylase/phosphopantothenate--cysteine ligase CoaBC [Polyangiaceae bacterium]